MPFSQVQVLDWKGFPGTNTLAYLVPLSGTDKKVMKHWRKFTIPLKLVISKACALYGRVIKLATAVYHLLAAITAVGMFVKWAPGAGVCT